MTGRNSSPVTEVRCHMKVWLVTVYFLLLLLLLFFCIKPNIYIYFLFFFRYKENAIAFSKIYKDSLLKPLDRAIYWIEYVLRNGGAAHLKSHAIQLNSIQYFVIDFIVSTSILVTLVTCLLYRTLKTVKRYYCKLIIGRPC